MNEAMKRDRRRRGERRRLQLVAWLLAVVLSPASKAGGGSEAVYAVTGADGVTTYTNRATGDTAARLEVPAVRHSVVRSAGVVSTAQLASTSTGRPARRPGERVRRLLPQLERLIAVVADRHGVDPHLVRAVIEVESGFNPKAVSPKGAAGLMQLMPATAARYQARDPSDPAQNIEAGTRYLRDLLEMFDGDTRLALAGYNAGEGAVKKYGAIPPYPETQNYVPSVLSAWRRNQADPSIPRLTASAR